jgi:hypothetical protein
MYLNELYLHLEMTDSFSAGYSKGEGERAHVQHIAGQEALSGASTTRNGPANGNHARGHHETRGCKAKVI